MKRIAGWTCLTLFIIVAAGCWVVIGFLNELGDELCGNTIIAEVLSPDKQTKAVVFQRNCGATTGFSTQVSLLPPETSLANEGGNVFVLDRGDNGDLDVEISWIDSTQLKIIYDHRARTFNQRGRYNGVSIIYQTR